MLWLTIVCAVAAVLFFAREAFADLHEVWKHPDQQDVREAPQHPKSRLR